MLHLPVRQKLNFIAKLCEYDAAAYSRTWIICASPRRFLALQAH
jgi:hypothetical protein